MLGIHGSQWHNTLPYHDFTKINNKIKKSILFYENKKAKKIGVFFGIGTVVGTHCDIKILNFSVLVVKTKLLTRLSVN